MSTPVVIAGAIFQAPVFGERGWADDASSLLVALANNVLFIDGTSQTSHPLTSDADFGPTNGLISAYFTSRSVNSAASGAVRLAQADKIAWRNANNTADLLLGVATNVLQFQGDAVVLATAAQTLTNKNLASVTNVLTGATAASFENTGTVALPTGPETLVGRATTDTLTNKTIDADNNTILDLVVGNLKAGVLNTSPTLAGATASQIPSALATQQAIASAAAGGAAKADKATVLTAGAGLSGGGDLSADRTFTVNVDDSTVEIASDAVRVKDAGVTLAKLASDVTSILDSKVDENAAITAGTATKITYDAKGLVTAGASLAASDMPASIDATKIADGSVDNVEFQYLSGVTSSVQTQLDARVVGPGSSVNNRLATFSGTTGKVVQESTVTADSSGNLVVPGDLTVNGTTTSVNSTNLDVADKQITVNKGGVSPSAEGSGIAVESDGSAVSSLAYDSTTVSKWRANGVELVNLTGAQTLSAKTLEFLRTQAEAAAISAGSIALTKGLSRITGGGTTLNSVTGNTADGAQQILLNGSGSDINITNAGNIQTGTGIDFALRSGSAVTMVYSSTLSKWVLTGGAGGGGLALSVRTTAFTAVANNHYLCNTTSATFTVTLPTGTTGAVIRLSDANRTWGSNNLTVVPSSGQIIANFAANESLVCDLNGAWIQLNWDGAKWVVDAPGYAASISSGSLSGGTGTGSLNIVDNPSAETSTTGWAVATNYTVARDTSNSPLAGVVDSCFAISTSTASAESSTSGVYAAALAVPPALRNSKLQGNLWVTVPATSAGVWRLSVYNAGGTRMTLDRDSSGVFTLPGGYTGQLPFTFDADSSTTYTISFTQTTRTSANTLYATLISIGNGNVSQTAPVGEWQSYTPTLTGFGTVSAVSCFYRRVGSEIQVRGKWTNGTVSGSNATITIPSGLTIDAANNGAVYKVYGSWVRADSAAPAARQGVLFASTAASTTALLFGYGDGGQSVNPMTIQTGSAISANSNEMHVNFTIAISEWAGSVNTAPVPAEEYAYPTGTWDSNTTTSSIGTLGAQLGALTGTRTKDITWQYPIQLGDRIEILGSTDRVNWVPIKGARLGASLIAVVDGIDSAGNLGAGILMHHTSSTTTRLTFAVYASQANDDSPANNWPSDAYVLVRKVRASALPFANAGTDGSAGLYKAGQAPGYTGSSAIPAGMVGQVASAAGTIASNTAGSAYQIANTGVLAPGVYLIYGSASWTGTASFTLAQLCINTTTASFGGATLGANHLITKGVTSDYTALTLIPNYVIITSNTTYYLNAQCNGANNVPTNGAIIAVRIA